MDRVDLYQQLYRTMMAANTPEQFREITRLIKAHRKELGTIETDDLLRIKANRYNEVLASRASLI